MKSHDTNDPILRLFLEAIEQGAKEFTLGKDFETITQRKIEVYAGAGDPFYLVEIGKQHYKGGQKELAFQYFDAAVNLDKKHDDYVSSLAELIGDNIEKDEEKQKLKYYSLAIKKGNDKLYKKQIAQYSNCYSRSYWDTYLFNAIAAKIDRIINSQQKINLSEDNKKRFNEWRLANPEKFKTFCIENSLATMKVFMGANVEYNYINIYKEELVDKIIAYMVENNISDINIAKKKFEKEYHPEYFAGIEALVNKTKEDIEETNAPVVLSQITTFIEEQKKVLLLQMEEHLKKHGYLPKGESPTEKEFLNQILYEFDPQVRASSSERNIVNLPPTFKNSVESQTLFLQLRALKSVQDALIPQEGQSETARLNRVVSAIEDANTKIKGENTYEAKLPGWSAFLISLTGIGIIIAGAMAHSYYKHGTYDFFSSDQKIAAKKAQAVKKSKDVFDSIQANKSRAEEFPTFKRSK
jgi:hypothetical protein